jgi:sialate O-acetylesterase
MRSFVFAVLAFPGLLLGQAARGDVKVAPVFGDHMVLQQGMALPVWGTASPGEKITVKFRGQEASDEADTNGRWLVKLPAMQATPRQEGTALTVAGKKDTRTFNDVLLGEVWLCAGQSNMEWTLASSDAPDDVAAADFPQIRHNRQGGAWVLCTPKTAPGFTGVGFYFARKVHKETGLPVGLLNNSIGGTRIEPWLAVGSEKVEPGLKPVLEAHASQVEKADKQTAAQLDAFEAWVKAARQAAADNKPLPRPPALPVYPASPFSGLYNSYTEPLRPYGLRGMLWYQGESNGGEGDIYFFKMKALVEGMRKAWGQGDFPCYLVQLPQLGGANNNPEGGDGWSATRRAQARCLTLPGFGMAVTIDVGDPGDIHPRNKKDVGERLALWALAKDYGKKDLVHSGPIFKSMKPEGDSLRLSFDHVGGGLMVGVKEGKKPTREDAGGKLQRFAIAGADGKWAWADAKIDGDTVVVSNPKVAKPVAVRYAYSQNPAGANLYNRGGLPASPFAAELSAKKSE